MQYQPKTDRNFSPKPKVTTQKTHFIRIMKPITDDDYRLLRNVRGWHKNRIELKEDGQRHRQVVRIIESVLNG